VNEILRAERVANRIYATGTNEILRAERVANRIYATGTNEILRAERVANRIYACGKAGFVFQSVWGEKVSKHLRKTF